MVLEVDIVVLVAFTFQGTPGWPPPSFSHDYSRLEVLELFELWIFVLRLRSIRFDG